MHHHHTHVHVDVDPDQLREFPNGIRVQEVTLVLSDDPDRPIWRALPPAVCRIDVTRARELAFELLTAAMAAE